jgi:hypothetical protein
MNENTTNKVHWSFWLISIFMLIWNILGCINFIVQMNPKIVSSYRETEQAIIQGRPLWATVGFAVAVFGGSLGCILLLLRKPAAFHLFVASLIGVVVTMVHSLTLNINFGIGEIIGIILMPIFVAVFLVWYSKYVKNRGWPNAT